MINPELFKLLVEDLVTGATPHSTQSESPEILAGTIAMLHTLMELDYVFHRNVKTNPAHGQISSYELACITPDGALFETSASNYMVNAEKRSYVVDRFIAHIWVIHVQKVATAAMESIGVKPKKKFSHNELPSRL